jgi:hypothetical protein
MKESQQGKWTTVTENLKSTMMRKKNLAPGRTYWFRVRSQDSYGWGEFSQSSEGFCTISHAVDQQQMDAPKLVQSDGETLVISWASLANATYEVQYRADGDKQDDWKFFLVGMNTITKNLEQCRSYVFRIRPAMINGLSVTHEWSPGRAGGPWRLYDTPVIYTQLFRDDDLVTNEGNCVPIRRLAGRIVGLFFGATWCRQSTAFAARLAKFYDAMRTENRVFEMIFISLDNNQTEMTELFAKLPATFMSIRYESPSRQKALSLLSVSQIPRLVIYGKRGQLLCQDAAGMPLVSSTFDGWDGGRESNGPLRIGYRAPH